MPMPGSSFAGSSGCAPGGTTHMSGSRGAWRLLASGARSEDGDRGEEAEADGAMHVFHGVKYSSGRVRAAATATVSEPETRRRDAGGVRLVSRSVSRCRHVCDLQLPCQRNRVARARPGNRASPSCVLRNASSSHGIVVRVELRGLEALVVDAQRAADRGRGVDDDDRGAARVGVDVDQAVEPHVEAAFFARLARWRPAVSGSPRST